MKLTIGEVFSALENAKSCKEKVEVLRKNDNKFIRDILRMNFDPALEFDLPPGAVPFKSSQAPLALGENQLYGELKRFYIFIKGGHPTLKMIKREFQFIDLLQGLDVYEAELLMRLKDKKIKGVTRALVDEVFPGLIGSKPESFPFPVIIKKR